MATGASLRGVVESLATQLREQDVAVDANRRALAVLEEDTVRTLLLVLALRPCPLVGARFAYVGLTPCVGSPPCAAHAPWSLQLGRLSSEAFVQRLVDQAGTAVKRARRVFAPGGLAFPPARASWHTSGHKTGEGKVHTAAGLAVVVPDPFEHSAGLERLIVLLAGDDPVCVAQPRLHPSVPAHGRDGDAENCAHEAHRFPGH